MAKTHAKPQAQPTARGAVKQQARGPAGVHAPMVQAQQQPPAPLMPAEVHGRRTPQGPQTIKVRATQVLYYGEARRRIGDVFSVEQHEFTPSCMEVVDDRTRERTTSAPEALRQEHDAILGGSVTGGANVL